MESNLRSTSQRQMRTPSSSRSSLPKVLTSDDVEQGKILWLPTKVEAMTSLRQRDTQQEGPVTNLRTSEFVLRDKFYNHPIFVISRPASSPDTIQLLLVSNLVQTMSKWSVLSLNSSQLATASLYTITSKAGMHHLSGANILR